MSTVKENALGKIEITDNVIGNIAGYAATRCYGVVGMIFKNKTDGIMGLLKRDLLRVKRGFPPTFRFEGRGLRWALNRRRRGKRRL